MKERVVIGTVDDIIPVLNKHEQLIFKFKDRSDKCCSVLLFWSIAGTISSMMLTVLLHKELKKRVENTDYIEKLRDQIDAQEQRILHLELEQENIEDKE